MTVWPGIACVFGMARRGSERLCLPPGCKQALRRLCRRLRQPLVQKRREPGAAGGVVDGAVGEVGVARLGAGELRHSWPRVVQRQMMAWVTSG